MADEDGEVVPDDPRKKGKNLPRVDLPGAKGYKDRWASTADTRQKFLDLAAGGMETRDICAQLDVAYLTYRTWRNRYPDWKATYDKVRHNRHTHLRQAPEMVVITKESTFAERRFAYFGHESYYHHHAMIDAIETAPMGGITMILLPPEHGKTTVLQDKVSDEIGENPNIRIGYVSGGLDLARKAIGQQQLRMGADGPNLFPRFHAAYGPFTQEGRDGKPWTTDYFTVTKANHDEKERTMEARGWTSRIAGTRLDRLYLDDIQELSSLNQTEAMVDKFRQDMLSRVGRRGKCVIIGTRVGEKDFYHTLKDLGLIDRLVELPATDGTLVDKCEMDALHEIWMTDFTAWEREQLREAATRVYDKEPLSPGQKDLWDAQPQIIQWGLMQVTPGAAPQPCDCPEVPHEKPLCPEMWPPHALARKRKQVGESAWWRNFQQKPRNAVDAVFTEDLTEAARDRFATIDDYRERRTGWRCFAGLDPSLTGGNTLIVCHGAGQGLRAVHLSRHFNMVRVENIIDDIMIAWKLTRFTDLVIEVNAFQKALGNDERLKELAMVLGFRIHQHTTGVNKADPDFGVSKMATSFLDGLVSWPWGDLESRGMFEMLEAELLAWRPNIPTRKIRQDTVMALWFCWMFWQKRRRSWLEDDIKAGRVEVQSRALPWRPQGYDAVRALARTER